MPVCLMPGASLAADPPLLAPRPYQPVPFVPRQVVDWTGLYFGVNAGYGWARSSTDTSFEGDFQGGTTTPNGRGATELSRTSLGGSGKPSGAIAGGQVGFNWQAGWAVFGAEFDAQWTGQTDGFTVACSTGCTATDEVRLKALLTGRARVGVAFDWIMPYVTAGAALASVSDDLTVTVGGVSGSFSTQSGSRLGWTAGAGVDFALTSNWSARLEYLYVNIEDIVTGGTSNATRIPNVLGVGSAIKGIDVRDNIVRVGLNYRFGPLGGPGILERPQVAPAGFASAYDFLPTITTYADRPTYAERAPSAKPVPGASMLAGGAPQREAPVGAAASATTSVVAARGTERVGAASTMLAGEVPQREAPIAVARAAASASAAEPAPAVGANERKRTGQTIKNFADIEDGDGSVGLAPVAAAITLPTLNKRHRGDDDSGRLKRIMSICSGC
jgi:outer membrane immunogenic protein